MNSMTERWIAGLVAAAALPLVLYGEFHWLGRPAAPGVWTGLIALPLYLTLGAAASIIADGLAASLTSEEEKSSRARSYAVRMALYAGAGFASLLGLAYAMFGKQAAFVETAAQAASVGVPAGVLYFHALLAIRAATARRHLRRFAQPVETERLVLLPCTLERYEAAAAEGYPIGNHVKTYLRSLRQHPRLLGWGVWLVRLKETGELVGDAGFKGNPDFAGAVDIGYGFLPEHRGRGYATEATAALVAWAFEHGAGRVTAETLRDNAASIRVLRKNGFRLYREDEHYHWRLDAIDRARGKA